MRRWLAPGGMVGSERFGSLPGANVRVGDTIAHIADAGRSSPNILPHLHFSGGRPSPDIGYESLFWSQMRYPGLLILNNPPNLVDWPLRGAGS